MMSRLGTSIAAAVAVLAALLVVMSMLPPAHSQQPRLPQVRSWAYQLQAIDPLQIAQSPYDLVVVDYALEKQSHAAMPREIVDIMRRKPDNSRRVVLAYLSIGEAENFRFYWRDAWLKQPPDWLERENPVWPGNYAVKYWLSGWQALMLGSPAAYLDQILDAGFDGVYLDGVDVFERLEVEHPSAMTDMVDFIATIASYARARRKDFLVIPQNGERILNDPRTLEIVDGFAREDLIYNEQRNGMPNPVNDVDETVSRLKAVTSAGKPVLVVEYVTNRELAVSLLREIASFNFVGYIASRDLRGLGSP
jgi:cysteinyl-tRNA synthetase